MIYLLTKKAYEYIVAQWIENKRWSYYSKVQADRFNEFPKYKESLNNLAKSLDKSLFKKIKFTFKTCIIDVVERTCSCRGFLKHAICSHSLALSHIKDWDWFGPKYTSRSNEFGLDFRIHPSPKNLILIHHSIRLDETSSNLFSKFVLIVTMMTLFLGENRISASFKCFKFFVNSSFVSSFLLKVHF